MPYKTYELLAQQVIDSYGKTTGRCLDLSSDQGLMGLEIARQSNLFVFISSSQGHSLVRAELNSRREKLADRIALIRSSVEDLPFIDNYFDLVISQGSILSWPDKAAAFREIFRVLKPGSKAYIGEGLSRHRSEENQQFGPAEKSPEQAKIRSPEYMQEVLRKAAIHNYNLVIGSESWIEIWK
ncbi:MAG TPA: class I SAM-dependent methyltransferase [Firmicutes bacterium]|nr:class I SAM-dependent methyltransferase [Bacillota bacterium]